jgi:hypothetical protein
LKHSDTSRHHSVRISDKETLEWPDDDPKRQPQTTRDVEQLAHWLDSVFEIPLLRIRFGVDALLGLVPGLGDTASAFASIYILQSAAKLGVSRVTMARMTLNILIDLLIGAIPLVGDLFDIYWKSNKRNVELLTRHIDADSMTERKLRRADTLFVALMIGLVLAVLMGTILLAYLTVSWLGHLLFGS